MSPSIIQDLILDIGDREATHAKCSLVNHSFIQFWLALSASKLNLGRVVRNTHELGKIGDGAKLDYRNGVVQDAVRFLPFRISLWGCDLWGFVCVCLV